jgi:hypothetical protein
VRFVPPAEQVASGCPQDAGNENANIEYRIMNFEWRCAKGRIHAYAFISFNQQYPAV